MRLIGDSARHTLIRGQQAGISRTHATTEKSGRRYQGMMRSADDMPFRTTGSMEPTVGFDILLLQSRTGSTIGIVITLCRAAACSNVSAALAPSRASGLRSR